MKCQEKLLEKNYYLHQSARDAYRSYILAYNSHHMKEIFNVHRLDLQVNILLNWFWVRGTWLIRIWFVSILGCGKVLRVQLSSKSQLEP